MDFIVSIKNVSKRLGGLRSYRMHPLKYQEILFVVLLVLMEQEKQPLSSFFLASFNRMRVKSNWI